MAKPLPSHLQNFQAVTPGNFENKKPPEGTYDVTLGLIKSAVAEGSGDPYFVAEYSIDAIIAGNQKSTKLRTDKGDAPFVPPVEVGDECSQFISFGGKWKDTARKNIKSLMLPAYSVLLQEVQSPAEIGDDELAAAVDEEEQMLLGTELRLVISAKLNKDKTSYYPIHKWMPRPTDPLYSSMNETTDTDD